MIFGVVLVVVLHVIGSGLLWFWAVMVLNYKVLGRNYAGLQWLCMLKFGPNGAQPQDRASLNPMLKKGYLDKAHYVVHSRQAQLLAINNTLVFLHALYAKETHEVSESRNPGLKQAAQSVHAA